MGPWAGVKQRAFPIEEDPLITLPRCFTFSGFKVFSLLVYIADQEPPICSSCLRNTSWSLSMTF
jgi:hypothetical protein